MTDLQRRNITSVAAWSLSGPISCRVREGIKPVDNVTILYVTHIHVLRNISGEACLFILSWILVTSRRGLDWRIHLLDTLKS
jgi:hypothetical protein